MAWTETTRRDYDRRSLRYASDCRDEEWALIEAFMLPVSKVGRPRKTNMRSVWEAIQYVAATGCQWAMLPKDFPPFTTVQYYFYRLRDSGLLDIINEMLVVASRLLSGRKAEPTAGIIDSQSVKTTESGGPCGYDAGKKIKGRKCHTITDTEGNMLYGPPIRPTFRTVMAHRQLSALPATASRHLHISSLMVVMQETSWKLPCSTWTGQQSRLSGAPTRQRALSSSPDAGWWSARSPGWVDAAGWQRIGKQQSLLQKHGC